MTPLQFTKNIQSLNRLRQIATTLSQHGFGHVVEQIDLARFVPVWMRRRKRERASTDDQAPPTPSIGRRLRQVCIELGPTFVKLGQLISSRPDAAPAEVLEELRKLQDDVDPFPSDEAVEIVETELGKPVDELFETFELKPAASGSIGQVHFARTAEGEDVVVKIQRPGIAARISQDIQLLHWLAESAERFLPELKTYQPVAIADEFELLLSRELDFINEASTTHRFYEAFADNEDLQVPRVMWDYTAPRVLTLERIKGRSIEHLLKALDTESRVLKRRIAVTLSEAYLKQIFDMGVFHADPHPGNILLEPSGKIALIDYGQTGTITEEFLTELIVLVSACVNRETALAIDTLMDMEAVSPRSDHRKIERAIRSMLDKYEGLPVKRVDPVDALHEFVAITRGADVRLPREISQLTKALGTLSGVVTQLEPELDLLAMIKPRIRRALRQRISPSQLSRASTRLGWDLVSILRKAPRRVRAIMRNLGTGSWQLQVRHENIDRLIKELDRSSNRLAFSVVIAAIIVGSSVVVSASTDLTIFGFKFQYFGIIGYLLAAVLGLGLAWAIFRSGRLH